jgi:hypothetical protein
MYITYEHDGFVIEQCNSIISQQFLVYTFSYITSPVSITHFYVVRSIMRITFAFRFKIAKFVDIKNSKYS